MPVSRYAEIAKELERMAGSGELRIRHFDRNSYHGSPVGKIRVLAGSVLEIHTGYPETLSNGTKLAYTERTGEFTIIASVFGAPQLFSVRAENNDHAREVYARTYGAGIETVIAVVPGEIGPISVHGTIEDWENTEV